MTNIEHDGGNDDRRNQPPVDPWLETSPTSPDFAPPAFDNTYFDQEPQRRRSRSWLVVAAVVALLACLGGTLLNPFDDESSPSQAGPSPQTSSSAGPSTKAAPRVDGPTPMKNTTTRAVVAEPAANEVVYLVFSGTKGDVASVQQTDQDRDIIRKGEVSLPWKHTFRFEGDKPPLVVIAQRKKGGTGAMTCSITLGGKELSTAVQRGRYASPQCSA